MQSEFDRHPWVMRISKEETRGPDFQGWEIPCNTFFSMREKIEVKAFAPPSNLVHGSYYFTYDI